MFNIDVKKSGYLKEGKKNKVASIGRGEKKTNSLKLSIKNLKMVELISAENLNIVSLIKRFEGVINAAESKYVMLNAHSHSTEIICKLLPGADSPTIIPLQKDNKVAIHALCKEPVFWETMERLKSNGASSILVLPVEKILN